MKYGSSHRKQRLTTTSKETLRWASPRSLNSEGVLSQSRRARYSDRPDSRHFVNKRLTVLTEFLPCYWIVGGGGDQGRQGPSKSGTVTGPVYTC